MKIGSIKPEVIALREFFKEESSSLQIPSIQRQFVWDAEDIKELIDSIVSGYPIGAIIIWEPTTKFPGAPLIGSSYKSSDLRYVLDGQQRLTALMLIQNGWELVRGMKKITTTPISYVPENGKLYLSSRKGIDVALIVNATLGDVESLTKLQRLYPAGYRKAMDGVGEKIVNYRLPFYVLKSDTRGGGDEIYEKIAEIFTRVNSAGVKIGNLEMFLSFFAAAFPKEAKEKIVGMYEELSDGFELDLEPLVRFIFSKMGMTQNQITKVASFKRSIQELKEGYSKERHKIGEVLAQAQKSIRVVVDLLDKELGLSTTQYVPSQSVLLPLFEYVYEKGYESVNKMGGKERNRLLKWFLIASFNGIYSSSPNHKIESDLEIIRSNGKNFPLEKLLSAMKDRTPHRTTIEKADVIGAYTNVLRGRAGKEYLMLLDILLYRNKATDWAGRMIKSEDAAVHHIFPRELLKENEETREDMINCLGNLTFISPSVNSEIGDESPDKYLPQYQEDILSQHLIPANRRYWKVENFQEFLDARLKLIWQGTRNLLEELD